ncbi:hypothetical protein EZS27_037630 [termite gut metagenome]|uniref:DarT domain-containing protein n=1 Tax=termite gut metagenome TaxID=433724 RepID=A0A5J4PNL2_9ZZZZ
MELKDIFLYRMTHIKNIPHTLRHGITHKNSPNANPDYVDIGDMSLISTRNTKKVYINHGDLEGSRILLGDFIPFYLGVKMPMLYVVQCGGNFVEKPTPPSDIIYLVCPILKVIRVQNNYYYTNGHATESFTSFFDKSMINELPEQVNWQAITAKYWGGDDNLTLKWQKQAEFLAENDIPPHLITNFGCYNDSAKNKLTEIGVDASTIKIIPNAYY